MLFCIAYSPKDRFMSSDFPHDTKSQAHQHQPGKAAQKPAVQPMTQKQTNAKDTQAAAM